MAAGAALLVAACASCATPAHAESPTSPASPSSTLVALGLKGQAILKGFAYFREAPADDELVLAEGILPLEWSRRLTEWADVKLVLEARKDTDT